jgi:diacylglycerol kinase (ATP)
MKKAMIIANPNAGSSRYFKDNLPEIESILRNRFTELEILWTEKAGDGAAWVRGNAHSWDVVITSGGDGTVHEIGGALAAIEENRPVFGILPGGTCNDFARALGMDLDPVAAAKQLAVSSMSPVDVGFADGRYFLNFWGVGLITQTSASISPDLKKGVGRFSYYLSALQQITTQPSKFRLRVKSDAYEFDNDAVMLLASNGPFTGGIRAFSPDSRVDNGVLDVLIVEALNINSIAALVETKLTGTAPDTEGLHYFQTDRLTVICDPDQEIDCDGEIGKQTPSDIQLLPGRLNVISNFIRD